jgi:hypothetical protein
MNPFQPCRGKIAHAEMLFACNTYHIGKERCYFQAALACGFSVWVSAKRLRTLQRLELPREWLALLTQSACSCDIIISDQGVGPPQLQALQAKHGRPVVGFQCTGESISMVESLHLDVFSTKS